MSEIPETELLATAVEFAPTRYMGMGNTGVILPHKVAKRIVAFPHKVAKRIVALLRAAPPAGDVETAARELLKALDDAYDWYEWSDEADRLRAALK